MRQAIKIQSNSNHITAFIQHNQYTVGEIGAYIIANADSLWYKLKIECNQQIDARQDWQLSQRK